MIEDLFAKPLWLKDWLSFPGLFKQMIFCSFFGGYIITDINRNQK